MRTQVTYANTYMMHINYSAFKVKKTRAHHADEIPERDVTYHLANLLIYH